MVKAIFNGEVIAESDKCIEVEGNQYFSQDSVKKKFLKKSGNTYTCSWKGVCDYYDGQRAFIKIEEPRLYNVVDGEYERHTLKLRVSDAGFSFHAFTFG